MSGKGKSSQPTRGRHYSASDASNLRLELRALPMTTAAACWPSTLQFFTLQLREHSRSPLSLPPRPRFWDARPPQVPPPHRKQEQHVHHLHDASRLLYHRDNGVRSHGQAQAGQPSSLSAPRRGSRLLQAHCGYGELVRRCGGRSSLVMRTRIGGSRRSPSLPSFASPSFT